MKKIILISGLIIGFIALLSALLIGWSFPVTIIAFPIALILLSMARYQELSGMVKFAETRSYALMSKAKASHWWFIIVGILLLANAIKLYIKGDNIYTIISQITSFIGAVILVAFLYKSLRIREKILEMPNQ